MRMLWIVTIAVLLFATMSHANRVNATHPRADALAAPSIMRAPNCLSSCLSRLAWSVSHWLRLPPSERAESQ